jgi:hypothetical protein
MDKNAAMPWKNVFSKTIWYTSYRDCDNNGNILRYLFVVKDKNGAAGLSAAVHSCYNLGLAHQNSEIWKNYQIKTLVGPESGAEIDQLYVELSPITGEFVKNE